MSIHDRLHDALERALAGLRAGLEPELRTLAHELPDTATAVLASAAEAIDRAGSLAGTLHALVEAAVPYADRVGLFLVRDGRVRAWRLNGVEEAAVTTTRTDRMTRFPISVDGSVVAILYAEGADARAGGIPALDLLTRYTGHLLESITLHAALGLTPPRRLAPPGDASATGGFAGQ
ncbi:MAG: hypothetical protein HYU37_11910 [Acidobacteria bacterium]|nr:hypothetical protein [Acidobacteriota bacterium]